MRYHAVWYIGINILQEPAASCLGCKSVMKGKTVCDVRKRTSRPYLRVNQSESVTLTNAVCQFGEGGKKRCKRKHDSLLKIYNRISTFLIKCRTFRTSQLLTTALMTRATHYICFSDNLQHFAVHCTSSHHCGNFQYTIWLLLQLAQNH